MSAGDRDTLAGIIAEHDWPLFSRECRCGEPTFGSEGHRAHVADVLLASDWLRERDDAKWCEGYHAGDCGDFNNPYRTTEDTE